MDTTIERFTRADYERLPEGFPAELLDGCLVKEPAPTWWHQDLAGEIIVRLHSLLGRGRVVGCRADIVVDDFDVLRPDVLVLSEKDRVRPGDRGGRIPVLVVEVLSPETAARDRQEKSAIYLRAGVQEVWIVDPEDRSVEVRTREGATRHEAGETARSRAVPGFTLDVENLFSGGG